MQLVLRSCFIHSPFRRWLWPPISSGTGPLDIGSRANPASRARDDASRSVRRGGPEAPRKGHKQQRREGTPVNRPGIGMSGRAARRVVAEAPDRRLEFEGSVRERRAPETSTLVRRY